jgi:hypothetical protein
MLYDSIKQEVIVCEPPPASPPVAAGSIPTIVSPILFLGALIFVPLTGVFGFL